MNSGRSISAEEALQQMQAVQARLTALTDVLRTQRNSACDENASLGVEVTLLRTTVSELRKQVEIKDECLNRSEGTLNKLLSERTASETALRSEIAQLKAQLETLQAEPKKPAKTKRSSSSSDSRA